MPKRSKANNSDAEAAEPKRRSLRLKPTTPKAEPKPKKAPAAAKPKKAKEVAKAKPEEEKEEVPAENGEAKADEEAVMQVGLGGATNSVEVLRMEAPATEEAEQKEEEEEEEAAE